MWLRWGLVQGFAVGLGQRRRVSSRFAGIASWRVSGLVARFTDIAELVRGEGWHIPWSPSARDHHPTDEDLSVGTPDHGHPLGVGIEVGLRRRLGGFGYCPVRDVVRLARNGRGQVDGSDILDKRPLSL